MIDNKKLNFIIIAIIAVVVICVIAFVIITMTNNKETEQTNSVEENVNYIKEMNEQGISAVVINPYSYIDTIGDREWSN